MNERPIIALLTDFGLNDWFTGAMKATILARVRDCTVVDLCHAIELGAVAQASWLLAKTFRDFPSGTVFCVVVDPGVGTERRALAARGDDYFFVAPDNGLLSGVRRLVGEWECRQITNPDWMRPSLSRTFHGRDVFAPAAAEIARLGRIDAAGDRLDDIVDISLPRTTIDGKGVVTGSIVYFDRFGNAITSIEREKVEENGVARQWLVEVGSLTVGGISSTYADVGPGEELAYWGSLETLEIAVRGSNARVRLGLRLGERVRLYPG